MDHLRRLGNSVSISIPADDDGFTGRECPRADCEGYFKIELGTGLEGVGIPCHCPYCDHTAGHDHFWTKAQIEYAQSVAIRKITDAVYKDLRKLEFDHKPKGAFGIGISMKVGRHRLTPIHKFREKKLETEIICASCTLRYAVYGVFAFCPDCGQMHRPKTAHRRPPRPLAHLIVHVTRRQHRRRLFPPMPVPKPTLDSPLAIPHVLARIIVHPKCLLFRQDSANSFSHGTGTFRVLPLLFHYRYFLNRAYSGTRYRPRRRGHPLSLPIL